MANQKTERTDKVVRDEMMRLLREGTKDPTFTWSPFDKGPDGEFREGDLTQAGYLLQQAEYFSGRGGGGRITLAGMDYYRRETADRFLTWLGNNWFGAIVAGCTIGVSIWGIVSS